jgi:hypothetical protein
METLKTFPFHSIAFSVYPVLALLATNLIEVELSVVVRPLLLSIAGSILLLILIYLVIKDLRKAGLLTSLFLILFFSYGHVYQVVELMEIFDLNIGRHRYLIPLYATLGTIGLWLIVKRIRDTRYATQVFNVISLILLLFPVVQILSFRVRLSSGEKAAQKLSGASVGYELVRSDNLPDIYYLVLDTYTREDALLRDFNFDNSDFLSELRQRGFYVADCSRSNYGYTQGSITAALNLKYLPDLNEDLSDLGLGIEDIWVLLKQSTVRRKLETIGYQTVAFDTGYEWSQLRDADYYYGVGNTPFSLEAVTPFEAMLLKSTGVLILTDFQSKLFVDRLKSINFPHAEYVQAQLFILEQIATLPTIEAPTFTFAHILIPHGPYVFDPEGNIREDSGYYGGDLAGPINERYLIDGYTGEIQFVNSRILEIVDQLLEKSYPAPIIIVHGDHGLRDENRFQILNAYYLPDDGSSMLYPQISPVNSFRVVFDTYFGTDLGLLPDMSFQDDEHKNPVPEFVPECRLNE